MVRKQTPHSGKKAEQTKHGKSFYTQWMIFVEDGSKFCEAED